MSIFRLLAILALGLVLGACVSQTVTTNSVPKIDTASTNVPEGQLLDVGISIFNPGIDDYEEGEQTYPEVRKAEAMPVLKVRAKDLNELAAGAAFAFTRLPAVVGVNRAA